MTRTLSSRFIPGIQRGKMTQSLCLMSSRTAQKYPQKIRPNLTSTDADMECDTTGAQNSDGDADLINDSNYRGFADRHLQIPEFGHRVLIIQPDNKLVARSQKITTPELQLQEACALVHTLRDWRIVKQMVLPTKRISTKAVFGKGTSDEIRAIIRNNPSISCVFVAIDTLTMTQLVYLRKEWKVPIYDRYTIVLQIFKENAKTKVAKLQVALAEVPYIRSRLSGLHTGQVNLLSGGVARVRPSGESYMDAQHQLLQDREIKLKRAVEKMAKQRELLRKGRTRLEIPVIAIVGYTNSGKTTLIKALTGDPNLVPKNQLFATLDVTVHSGKLPNQLSVLYVDTVGFISDIPTSLIDAFRATLEDALIADVVIHVRDISHPNTEAQRRNVLTTLTSLLPREQIDKVIEVCNKVDRLERTEPPPHGLQISAVTGAGLNELKSHIQDAVIDTTDLQERCFKIPADGQFLSWLHKECTVTKTTVADDDDDKLLVTVLISDKNYTKFKQFMAQTRQR